MKVYIYQIEYKSIGLPYKGSEKEKLYHKEYRENHKKERKLYDKNHKGEKKLYDKERRNYIKYIVLLYYSNYNVPKCACCLESNINFLGLDHINGDGADHRRSTKYKTGNNLYSLIITNNFPSELEEKLQVLCHNCNHSKRTRNSCIHKRKINIIPSIISYITEYNRKERHECCVYYSESEVPFCACCGITEDEFLTFDHINGGGKKHLKEINCHLSHWLKRNNFPPGYRVLCMNCNKAVSHGRTCPHKLQKFI